MALVGLVVLLHVTQGSAHFTRSLRALAPWLPALILLELTRVGADLLALRALVGPDARRLAWGEWVRIHLMAQAALVVLPAGRALSEGLKMARFSPLWGAARATALLATLHTTTLASIALVALLATVAAWHLSASLVAVPLALHALFCLTGAIGLRLALERAIVPQAVARWLGDAAPAAGELRREARSLPRFPRSSLGFKLVNRLAQALQFSLLTAGRGGLAGAVLASATSTLGGAFDLSVASVGPADAALAAIAPALSIEVAGMLAALATLRVAQLTVSAVGGILALSSLLAGKSR